MSLETLGTELEGVFARGVDAPATDLEFDGLALKVFEHQFRASEVYRAFCLARGVTPESVSRWQDVPAVPTSGFKHVRLLSADGPEATFRTSGTTGGDVRGIHLVPRLSLYRASLIPNFRAYVLAGVAEVSMLSLIPRPQASPESSLSYMIGAVSDELVRKTRWLAESDGLAKAAPFVEAAAELSVDGPVLVTTTAFALVHLLDGMEAEGLDVRLPSGSRLMETGGFKGRSRTVARDELYERVQGLLGVPARNIVNEYGMTELLSQLYEPVLREPGAARRHEAPPWLRVRALDPTSLEPVPDGTPGILAFFDLANVGSVAHVLTEDVGVLRDGALWLQGRTPGAEPRGCSLAVEELILASAAGS